MCTICAALSPANKLADLSMHAAGNLNFGFTIGGGGGGGGLPARGGTGGGTGPSVTSTMLDALAGQLTTGFWAFNGGGIRSFVLDSSRQITVNFAALDAETQLVARAALDAWTDVTGINFVNSADAQITFGDDEAGAFSYSQLSGRNIISSIVNVEPTWDTDPKSVNSYWFQTYLHEIGHALGLGHAGNYNGSATWGRDTKFASDSWQATVMSYFPQTTNPNTGGASYAFTATAMAADIIAIQALYGTSVQARAGDTVYGNNSNVDGYLGDLFDQWMGGAADTDEIYIGNNVTLTIFDTGGIDTLDVSGTSDAQRVDLNAEAKSDVAGLKGNIIIARGTVVENAVGGSGDDTLSGNAAANTLTGGDGADALDGRAGNDTLFGDDGNDTLTGGAGNDLLVGGVGADRFDGGTQLDTVSYETSTGALIIDLTTASLNTGDALGDTFIRVESIIGGAADDRISGASGAEQLFGMNGDDVLFGRAGKDVLQGGEGNDTLVGGAGADTLVGGNGRDVADYSGAGRAVTANLTAGAVTRTPVSDAAGDTFESIEDLKGSAFADKLTGDSQANAIWGNDGNDILNGVLGDDTLTGGVGADTFVFSGGADLVTDFVDNIDAVSIARSLFASATVSVAQALALAVVEGSNIVFHFNGVDTLTLAGITDINALQDDLIFA